MMWSSYFPGGPIACVAVHPQLGDSGRRWILQNTYQYNGAPATDRKNACTRRRCAQRLARSINLAVRERSHRGITCTSVQKNCSAQIEVVRKTERDLLVVLLLLLHTRSVHLARHCWCMQHLLLWTVLALAVLIDTHACTSPRQQQCCSARMPRPHRAALACETRRALVRFLVTHTRSSPAYAKHVHAHVCRHGRYVQPCHPPYLHRLRFLCTKYITHTHACISSLLASHLFPSADLCTASYICVYIHV